MEAVMVAVEDVEWIVVEETTASGQVRRSATALAQRLGFSEHRTGEIAIAVTELATNLHKHATQGLVLLRVRRDVDCAALEIVVIDSGPGIADLSALSQDGRSTVGTLGIGLGAAMRLATWFDGYSLPGRGTVIVATFWPAEAPIARPTFAALTRAMGGEFVCGDAFAERNDAGISTFLLADGLGHGQLAAIASREAVRAFLAEDGGDPRPAETLRRLDSVLRITRGAAAAVVRIDYASRMLTFAGVGNIAVWIDDGERRRGLSSNPGIVGNNTKIIREVDVAIEPHALVIMHSDGLNNKWDLLAYPGLHQRDPHLIAATLMRDAAIRHDDASVVVARCTT